MLSAGRRARSKASKSRSRRVRREKAGRCGEAHIPFQNGAENRIILLRRPQFTIPMPTPSVNRLASKSRKLPACEPCRAMKLRCDHGRPSCSRCRTRGLADGCVYRTRPFKRRLTRSLSGQAEGTSRAQSSYVREDSTIRSREDDAASVPSNASVSTATAIPFVQYPNPGYLGSFSHTTLFDQLPPQNNAEPGAESQQSEDGRSAPNKCVIDDICINKGAELILGLHREFSIRSLAHLFQKWVSTGANLALAGPLTGSCASAVDYTLAQCDGKYSTARAISKRLFHNSCQPILSNPETAISEYCTFFSGANARWEAFGIFFVAICRASVDIPYAEPLYDSEQPRRRLQKLALSYSDQCLELCLPLDCMNDLQLLLQYENFISHSQVDGDQSYLSWRKLGDVAASLYALGYHQQQTESFRTAPSFLRDLRQTAFCRTYSADKNVSIFLGRPPRILRKFCYFHLPGTLAQPNQKAGRTPAVWDPSEKPSFVTDSKWAALCGILKEDILDLFAEESYEERARQGQLIDADARAQWDALPESYRLEGSLKTCNRPPVERDFMVNMKLNYLHVHFLLRRALLRPMSMGPAPELFNISKDMLGLVVETILLKDQIVNSGTSLVWKVVYYGLSAAGLVSLHLANQSYANEMLEMDISKIFQDLSILVGEIVSGTLVYVDSPNYALLSEASQTIKSLLDRMILPLQISQRMGTTSGNRSAALPGSEPMGTLNDGGLDLWYDSNFQDFEMSFWHHLAGHPFLHG